MYQKTDTIFPATRKPEYQIPAMLTSRAVTLNDGIITLSGPLQQKLQVAP